MPSESSGILQWQPHASRDSKSPPVFHPHRLTLAADVAERATAALSHNDGSSVRPRLRSSARHPSPSQCARHPSPSQCARHPSPSQCARRLGQRESIIVTRPAANQTWAGRVPSCQSDDCSSAVAAAEALAVAVALICTGKRTRSLSKGISSAAAAGR